MIRVLTTSYNGSKYVKMCLESLKAQEITDWKCYITDDMSTDNSIEVIENLIKGDPRFRLIKNSQKFYQTGNYYQVLRLPEIANEDICVTLDGDDWLYDSRVFNRVLNYYEDCKTWMTFGGYVHFNGRVDIGTVYGWHKPTPFNNARNLSWSSSHLRTFKAGLFRKIDPNDIVKENKSFYNAAGDVVLFNPMLEMAGEDRVKYVNDMNYVYNIETDLNEHKKMFNESVAIVQEIGRKPKYKRLP